MQLEAGVSCDQSVYRGSLANVGVKVRDDEPHNRLHVRGEGHRPRVGHLCVCEFAQDRVLVPHRDGFEAVDFWAGPVSSGIHLLQDGKHVLGSGFRFVGVVVFLDVEPVDLWLFWTARKIGVIEPYVEIVHRGRGNV